MRKAPGCADFDFGQFIPLLVSASELAPPVLKAAPVGAPAPAPTRVGPSGAAGAAKRGGEILRLGIVEHFELLDATATSGPVAHGGAAARRGVVTATSQQYEVPLLPQGCIFKFVLSACARCAPEPCVCHDNRHLRVAGSSHGDAHYIGLNGLEMFDGANRKLDFSDATVDAVPRDVNSLVASGARGGGARGGGGRCGAH